MDVEFRPSLLQAAEGRSQEHYHNFHQPPPIKMRKRKADTQDNERLSKRLSLLNLEQNGQKLYVPVESPQLKPMESTSLRQLPANVSMPLDDSKHKVYIYDLDAELSDSGESDDGKMVFLPDIEKHLRQTRIPPAVLANKDGELAGMQMVLYSEPTSLTIPEEQDSVRRAIIEARARARRTQKGEPEPNFAPELVTTMETEEDVPLMDAPDASLVSPPRVQSGLNDLANDNPPITNHAVTSNSIPWPAAQDDPDAMDMD